MENERSSFCWNRIRKSRNQLVVPSTSPTSGNQTKSAANEGTSIFLPFWPRRNGFCCNRELSSGFCSTGKFYLRRMVPYLSQLPFGNGSPCGFRSGDKTACNHSKSD